MSIWFITGANRGFGLELATLALSNGDAVVAAARRPDQAEKALGGPQDQLLTVSVASTFSSTTRGAASPVPSRRPPATRSAPRST
jgi:NAD(P)-dependent dehydrogenase (short-subunit alcohol dehydrogenase family)